MLLSTCLFFTLGLSWLSSIIFLVKCLLDTVWIWVTELINSTQESQSLVNKTEQQPAARVLHEPAKGQVKAGCEGPNRLQELSKMWKGEGMSSI